MDFEECGSVVAPSKASKEMKGNKVMVVVEVHREDVREVETLEQCDNHDIRNVDISSYFPSRVDII